MAAPVALVVADVVALVAFVAVGVANPRTDLVSAFATTAVPVLVAWAVVALAVATYRRVGWRTLALTWVVAIPLGAVGRSLVRGGPWDGDLAVFTLVALAFSGLFLAAGRFVVTAVGSMRRSGRDRAPTR